jgi:hypothetical protein
VARAIHSRAPAWTTRIQPPYYVAGWAFVVKALCLNCPPPPEPLLTLKPTGSTRTIDVPEGWRLLSTPASCDDDAPLEDHLELAMRNEGPNMMVLGAAVSTPRAARALREATRRLVTGNASEAWCRRLWFLHEWMTAEPLPVPDALAALPYVDVLDPDRYYTSLPVDSPRHRVRDNLLGVPAFCPSVRRTASLQAHHGREYGRQAAGLLEQHAPILAREYTYDMVLQETVHSMRIEGVHYETVDIPPLVETLMRHGNFDAFPLNEDSLQHFVLPALMGVSKLPDTSFGLRQRQVYVSETTWTVDDAKDCLKFVAARPPDLPQLLRGVFQAFDRALRDRTAAPESVDCVVTAAALGFGLVFVHPFDDGNGRAHRFFIQQALRRLNYVPQMLFPVSRIMVRQPELYMEVLEAYDEEVMPYTEYHFQDAMGTLTVTNPTAHLFRYFDATASAEYLYRCVRVCLEDDLPEYCALVGQTWDHLYV